ncbi:MAG: VTT domain-containing protein [Gammaproteobacteria bacterium]|nr:VTT domain-containing protein [Gammaproteobacteria bacterium]
MSTSLKTARSKRKLAILVIAAILLTGLAWYVNNYISLEELAEQESRVRTYISLNPWRSFIVGFGIYAGLALVPGTGGKAIVYGWLFGFWQAVTIVSVGLTLAAMAIFSLSRYLFRESIERRYTNPVALMNKHLAREGAFYLLALRMAHAPYSVVNPISGASRVRIWTFCWTTAVGMLPVNAIWVYVGVRLPSLRDLASSGPGAFVDLPLILAMVGCAALAPLIRWLLGHFGIIAFRTGSHAATNHESQQKNHDHG